MNGEWLRLGVGGVVPVSWDLTSKSGQDPGGLEGWASVYNVVDEQDDIVVPGAFRKTLADWRSSGRSIPLSKDHSFDNDSVIGSLSHAEEAPYGLRIRASFASTPDAQNLRTKAVEKHIRGLSIFGPIFQKDSTTREGRPIRVLKEVGLLQVALTPYPANVLSLTTAAKTAMVAAAVAELDPRWEEDMRAALRISSPLVRRVAIESLMKARYPDLVTAQAGPAGDGDASTGDDVHKTTDQVLDDAALYALTLIGESGPSTSPGGEPNPSLVDLEAIASAEATRAALTELEKELRQAS